MISKTQIPPDRNTYKPSTFSIIHLQHTYDILSLYLCTYIDVWGINVVCTLLIIQYW